MLVKMFPLIRVIIREENAVKQVYKLTLIGIIAGIILALFLKIVELLTGKQVYNILFNMDYIPVLKHVNDVPLAGYIFHFIFCIASVVILFYLLKLVNLERIGSLYVLIYTFGSAILYFLTLLTNQPPEATDIASWFYWTISHLVYGLVVVKLMKSWD